MLIGNKEVRQRLYTTIEQDRVHAFLLVGPDQVGKNTLAEEVAGERLGRTPRSIEPDIVRVSGEDGTISLQAVQTMVAECSHAALHKRTVVIQKADRLTPEAANALLVFLEQPPERSIIFLTVRSVEGVLPTIRSRCVPFVLGPVADGQIKEGLQEMGLGHDQALMAEAVALCIGLPGRAVRFVQDQRYRARLRELARTASRWHEADPVERLKLAAKLAEKPEQVGEFLGHLSKQVTVAHKPELLLALRRLNRNVQPRAVLEAYAMVTS